MADEEQLMDQSASTLDLNVIQEIVSVRLSTSMSEHQASRIARAINEEGSSACFDVQSKREEGDSKADDHTITRNSGREPSPLEPKQRAPSSAKRTVEAPPGKTQLRRGPTEGCQPLQSLRLTRRLTPPSYPSQTAKKGPPKPEPEANECVAHKGTVAVLPEREDASMRDSSTSCISNVGAYAVGGIHPNNSDCSDSDCECSLTGTDAGSLKIEEDQQQQVFGGQPLVTAAEVYEESPEQQKEKEAQLEEEIKRRIIDSAVEANVVLGPFEEDDAENKNPSGPTRGLDVIMAAIGCLVVAAMIGLMVAFLPKELSRNTLSQDSTPFLGNDQSSPFAFPPNDTLVAYVPYTICYERVPLFGKSELCPEQELGSAATNLVALSRLWNFPEADLSILNAGEVKNDIKEGNFTAACGWDLLPYNNSMVVLQVPGKELAITLERALQKLVDDFLLLQLNETNDFSAGAYPYGAGIRYRVNMSETFPNRLSSIEVNPRLAQDYWVPLDPSRSYSVVTSGYLAGGGDGYNEFNRLPEEAVNDTGVHSLAAFLEYAEHIQMLEEPPTELFSTQMYTNNLFHWSCDLHCDKD